MEARVPDETHFPYAYVALAISRQEWPPEPRRGTTCSDTQLREEIAHGAKSLPLRTAIDRFGAGRLKAKATDLGVPKGIFEGRSSWSPGQTYTGLCREITRPLHPEKYSVIEVRKTPTAVVELVENKVFQKVEGEIELWDWMLAHAAAVAQEESAVEAFETVRDMKTIGPTGTSACTLGKRILHYCQGVTLGKTLGKTVFGSSQKTPPFANDAEYEKEIPRFHEIWRDRTDLI